MLSLKLSSSVSESDISRCAKDLSMIELDSSKLSKLMSVLCGAGRPSKSKKLVEVGGVSDVFEQLLSMGLEEERKSESEVDASKVSNDAVAKAVVNDADKAAKYAATKAAKDADKAAKDADKAAKDAEKAVAKADKAS